MIEKEANPIAWALLNYELSDAHEHLDQLLQEMEQPGFGEEEYRIWLAHIYAHLNRAWNRRDVPDAQAPEEYADRENLFPTDLTPL